MQFDQIILVVALCSVAGILFWGVITMARGGEYNVKNSNRIMRYRIVFQAIALLLILGLMWYRRQAG
ncbi:twin transmembrane helix small protein [Alphaproteobacteria bacterium LSUCC0226]